MGMKHMIGKRLKKHITYSEGWTLVETLVVIGIIMILTGTVGFSSIKYIEKAKVAKAQTQIESFSLALQSYYFDCSGYPDESIGLEGLWEIPSGNTTPDGWDGPYVTKPIEADPWGNAYIYQEQETGGMPYVIISYGADGKEGGEGSDEDIRSSGW